MGTSEASIKEAVRETYSARAKREASCCDPASFKRFVLTQLGYSPKELDELPSTSVEMSGGCGNPTALADLKPGEVVLDLGSGGGIDVFLAARKVGPHGRAIGVDMAEEVLERARENAKIAGLTNVEFRMGEIEKLPVDDNSVDIIISNCVINLSPNKEAVFREAFRVLRPGGRIAVSDIVTHGEIPPEIRGNIQLWANCLGGAEEEEHYLSIIRDAGFHDVRVAARTVFGKESIKGWLEAYPQHEDAVEKIFNSNLKIVSVKVTAHKPSTSN